MRWAFVTIRLSWAWRKMWESRTTPIASESIRSSRTLPGPDRGELVHVSDEHEGPFPGQGLDQVVEQDRVDHGGLVHDQELAVEGVLSIPLEAALLEAVLEEAVKGLGRLARDLLEPLGRPARGRAEEAADSHGPANGHQGPHQGGLAGSRAAGDDEALLLQGLLDRLALLRDEGHVEFLLRPVQGVLHIQERDGGGVLEEGGQVFGNPLFGLVEGRQVNGLVVLLVGLHVVVQVLEEDLLGGEEVGDGPLQDLHVLDLQECLAPFHERRVGEEEVPLGGGLLQDEQNPGLGPPRGVRLHTHRPGDAVRGLEADAEDVGGEPVRVLLEHRDRLVAVALVDLDGESLADPVPLEEEHDLPDLALRVPGRPDLGDLCLAEALDLSQAVRFVLDDLEGFLTEPVREPLGQDRADALDQAAGQVPLDPVDGCGGEDRVGFDLELPAELLVVDPLAGEEQILARVHGEQVAHDGRELGLPLPPDAGDREAVVLVRVDDVGQFAFDLKGCLHRLFLPFSLCSHRWAAPCPAGLPASLPAPRRRTDSPRAAGREPLPGFARARSSRCPSASVRSGSLSGTSVRSRKRKRRPSSSFGGRTACTSVETGAIRPVSPGTRLRNRTCGICIRTGARVSPAWKVVNRDHGRMIGSRRQQKASGPRGPAILEILFDRVPIFLVIKQE